MPDTRSIRLVTAIALVAILPALGTGCWFVAGGAVAAGAGGGGGGGDGVINAAPSLISEDPGRLTADQVDLEVVVFDTNNQAVSVAVTLIKAPGQGEIPISLVSAVVVDSSAPLTVGAPEAGNVVSGIPATAAGTRVRITWQASDDQNLQQALLNPTLVYVVDDGQAQSAPVQETGDGFVLGNDAPDTSAVSLQGTVGNVTVTFTVSDSTADPVNAAVEFSTDGFDADIRSATIVVGGLTDLAAPTGGQQHTVSWDTITDLGIQDVAVTVRVSTDDGFGGQDTDTATVVTIDNDTAPIASILSVGTADGFAAVDGRIPIRFALFDEEADLDLEGPSGRPDVRIEVTADPGQPGSPATGLPRLRNAGRDVSVLSLRGLRARPGPDAVETGDSNVHTFLWDALADGIGGVGTLNVAIKVIPVANGVDGQADTDTRFLGDGAPLFGAEEVFSVASQRPSTIAVADLDLDGFLDVVATGDENENDTIRIFYGDGLGGVATTLPLTGSSQDLEEMVTSDLNGDGLLDLVYSSQQSGLCVRLNTGGRTFGAESTTASGQNSKGLALGDLDGDGDQDAVVTGRFNNEVIIHQGDGTGGIAAIFSFTVGLSPQRVTLGDLNGDGFLDIVCINNEDDDTSVLLGDGTLAGFILQLVTLTTAEQPVDLTLGDINEDGAVDLLVASENGNVINVLLGAGDGTFVTQPTLSAGLIPTEVTLHDLNGDGHLDLVSMAPTSQDVRVRLGDGTGAFKSEAAFGFSSRPLALVVADLDGDGQLDLIVGSEDGVRMRRGTGGGGAGAEVSIPTVAAAAATADLNNDGVLDLVVAQALDQRLDTFLGEGGGRFADALAQSVATGVEPLALSLADLNGDGDQDVVTKEENGRATVALAQGDGTFLISTSIVLQVTDPPDGLGEIPLGDLNGDGFIDIVYLSENDAVIPLFGDGAGDFVTQPTIFLGTSFRNIDIVDIDADGFADILFADAGPGAGRIRFGPDLVSEVILPATDESADVTAADIDGDGRLDLVIANNQPDSLSVYLATGNRLFGGEIRLGVTIQPSRIVLADTDGDGMLDLVLASESNTTFSIKRPRPNSGARLGPVPGFGRGDGHGSRLIFSELQVPTATSTFTALVGEISDDGVTDVVLVGGGGTGVLVTSAVVASLEVPQVFLTAEGVTGRMVPTDPFNLRRDPPAASNPGTTVRFVEASTAQALLPDTASIDTATLTLPLHAYLTNEELTDGILRVFRNQQSLTPQIDPILGTAFFDNLAEVARRDPADPTGSDFPAGVVVATVDSTAGTFSFDVTSTGRFQAFLEIDETAGARALLFRETFDAPPPDGFGDAPLPPGWAGSANWGVGVAGGLNRPAAASSPNLAGIGLDFDYREGAADILSSTRFVLNDPQTRRVTLRSRVWHDLGTGDSVEVGLNFLNVATGDVSRQVLKVFTGLSDPVAALALDEVDITAAVTEGLSGATGVAADSIRGAVCSLDFVLTSDSDGGVGRGFFVDDLEVVLAP